MVAQAPGEGLDSPYPLKSQFQRYVLPGLIILTIAISLIMGKGSTWLTQNIYLQVSENRAASIDVALKNETAASWDLLQRNKNPQAVFETPEGRILLDAIRKEVRKVRELGLSHLKIYGDGGLILFSTEENEIGTSDPSEGYLDASNGVRSLIEKELPDGTLLYELYVKVPDNTHGTVMELYEPVDYLDAIVEQVIIPAIIFPIAVLLLVGGMMYRLVFNAQADINYRTDLITRFRNRLQRLVSDEAVSALRSTTDDGAVASHRVRATILFSDIRGFTDFCEHETPERIVSFLNTSLGIVIDAVHQHSGNVDKMIGDAVLAYFHGEDAVDQALLAAKEAQANMARADLSRGIGIGIYSGDVIIGTVGTAERMDFTIIGDTVNVASRLCSHAKIGEIIIDLGSLSTSQTEVMGTTEEEVHVKGREEALNIMRLT